MIARPALPAVLAALTDIPVEDFSGRRISLADAGVFRAPRSFPGLETLATWITTDPAEAWEILDARGLLPPEGSRGFWCRRCDGRGSIALGGEYPERDYCDACSVEDVTATGGVRACGWTVRPATIPDLVAWASLDAGAIVTAEALCREIAPALAPPCYDVDRCERVVWRVGDARRSPGFVAKRWTSRGGDSALVFTAAETIAPVRALWDAGLALERVGAECVLCVPPIGGAT